MLEEKRKENISLFYAARYPYRLTETSLTSDDKSKAVISGMFIRKIEILLIL